MRALDHARIDSTPELSHSFYDEIDEFNVVAFISSGSQLIVVLNAHEGAHEGENKGFVHNQLWFSNHFIAATCFVLQIYFRNMTNMKRNPIVQRHPDEGSL
jgi:hypothetical protein